MSLAINQIDLADTREPLEDPQAGDPDVDRPRSVVLGLAVASMRTVVMVVLVTLAILVVLPAAIAAQAAVGI